MRRAHSTYGDGKYVSVLLIKSGSIFANLALHHTVRSDVTNARYLDWGSILSWEKAVDCL